MFLPSTIFGHMAQHCNHVVSSPDENNSIKKVYIFASCDNSNEYQEHSNI